LALRKVHELDTEGVTIHAIGFGDTDGDRISELVVGGGVRPRKEGEGEFFLETFVYKYSNDFHSEWRRVGGGADERPVRWMIVSRDEPRE
jgi:hypothetical protein